MPDVVDITAEGVEIKYDPAGDRTQELVKVNSATILLPSFGVRGTIRPFDPNTGRNVDPASTSSGLIPGLVVRPNGFSIGVAELAFGIDDPNRAPLTSTTGQSKISFGGIVEFDDLRVGVQNFTVNFDAANALDFNGSIYVASGGARFMPGRPFSAAITDRATADDRNSDGSPNDEAIRLQLSFTDGKVDSFQFRIDTMSIQLGNFVTLTARDFFLDTGAEDDEEMVSFQAIGAKVKIGSLEIGGEARNFAFMGDGSFRTKQGFGVFLSVGSATGDSFKWPSFLPIRIDALGIQWDDIEDAPEDFVLTLSASVTGLKGVDGLQFTGSIQGMKIKPSLLLEGKFPIIGIDALGVSVKGNLFGGEIDAVPGRRHPEARLGLQPDRRLRLDHAGGPARLLPGPPGRIQDRRSGGLHDPRGPERARPAVGLHQHRGAGRHRPRAQLRPGDQRPVGRRRVLQDAAVDRRPVRPSRIAVPAADRADRRPVAQPAPAAGRAPGQVDQPEPRRRAASRRRSPPR